MSLPGLSPRVLLALSRREGDAVGCLAAVRRGRAGSDADRELARSLRSEEIETRVSAAGAAFVPVGSADYPPQLEHLSDPPAGLFVIGRSTPALAGAVAVVGARQCSQAGRDLARSIGGVLGWAGACVVSGAARGIDAAAHEGALEAGGHTLAVLGGGIDLARSSSPGSLLGRIAAGGTVVSEYPPGVPPMPFRFPARNRIIAGLSRALVVVEGAEGSGSMISADHALDLGREVFAVPGAVTNPLAHVPNSLIRDGATLVRGGEDLLDDLGLNDGRLPAGGGVRRHPPGAVELSEGERAVLERVTGSVLPEAVARELGVTLREVVAALMILEMKGLVRSVGGRVERRLPT
ncbi:MAG TPA: DNA-processing protein DprA [Actinomycetota bacterium]|nr:DNA-processing protein DprA [Actinomycetota bacterium]